MLKEAYAFGAKTALQELGYDMSSANAFSIKLADEGMNPVLKAILGTGLGLAGGAALGGGLGAGATALAKQLGKKIPNLSALSLKTPNRIKIPKLNMTGRQQRNLGTLVRNATSGAALGGLPAEAERAVLNNALWGNVNIGARALGGMGALAGGVGALTD